MQQLSQISFKGNNFCGTNGSLILRNDPALSVISIEDSSFEQSSLDIQCIYLLLSVTVACPSLKRFEVGYLDLSKTTKSFSAAKTLSLSNMNTLNYILIGNGCFTNATTLSLMNIPELNVLAIGSGSFNAIAEGNFTAVNVNATTFSVLANSCKAFTSIRLESESNILDII